MEIKDYLKVALCVICIGLVGTMCECCSVYENASETNPKRVTCGGKTYFITSETSDSIYIEILDKWVPKSECEDYGY